MATLNLLTVVQKVLSEMNGDNVNSITDTVESEQVVGIIRTVFDDVCDEFDLPEQVGRVQLSASGDPTKPTHMTIDGTIVSIGVMKYDKRLSALDAARFQDVYYVSPVEFLTRSLGLTSTDTNVLSVTDATGTPLYVFNDRAPTSWTSFDEQTVVMDGYDSALEATLQTSKTIAMGRIRPTFSSTNGYLIPFSNQIRSLFENEVMSRCFAVMKQAPNEKAEQACRRLRTRLQRSKSKTKPFPTGPESGRIGPNIGSIPQRYRNGD